MIIQYIIYNCIWQQPFICGVDSVDGWLQVYNIYEYIYLLFVNIRFVRRANDTRRREERA